MICATVREPTYPTTRTLDRLFERSRVLEQESLMDEHGLDENESAVLRAMGGIERAIHPLRPFGLAGDADIASEAKVHLYECRRALASLRNRGLVERLVGGLRWSITDEGRARIASTKGAHS